MFHKTEFRATLYEAAEKIVCLANESGKTVTTEFRGITLMAHPGDKSEVIVAYFRQEYQREEDEYRSSPAGKQVRQKEKESKASAQEECDALIKELQNLNFEDNVVLLDWLCKFQSSSNCIGISFEPFFILGTFADHGYLPNVNLGKDFDENDRDNHARYLIGQCLNDIRLIGAINPVIHQFTKEWKERFNTK